MSVVSELDSSLPRTAYIMKYGCRHPRATLPGWLDYGRLRSTIRAARNCFQDHASTGPFGLPARRWMGIFRSWIAGGPDHAVPLSTDLPIHRRVFGTCMRIWFAVLGRAWQINGRVISCSIRPPPVNCHGYLSGIAGRSSADIRRPWQCPDPIISPLIAVSLRWTTMSTARAVPPSCRRVEAVCTMKNRPDLR